MVSLITLSPRLWNSILSWDKELSAAVCSIIECVVFHCTKWKLNTSYRWSHIYIGITSYVTGLYRNRVDQRSRDMNRKTAGIVNFWYFLLLSVYADHMYKPGRVWCYRIPLTTRVRNLIPDISLRLCYTILYPCFTPAHTLGCATGKHARVLTCWSPRGHFYERNLTENCKPTLKFNYRLVSLGLNSPISATTGCEPVIRNFDIIFIFILDTLLYKQ